MRWRVRSTISIGPIRFLRSASRNSATVLASTPAFLAGREAVRAVVFAALRAVCWRPRAWPPFFAAALRLVADAELDELLRAEVLRLREEAVDDRALDARPFAELAFLDPPLDFPVLLRSAMSLSLVCSKFVVGLFPQRRTISPHNPRRPHLEACDHGRVIGQAQAPAVGLGKLALLRG